MLASGSGCAYYSVVMDRNLRFELLEVVRNSASPDAKIRGVVLWQQVRTGPHSITLLSLDMIKKSVQLDGDDAANLALQKFVAVSWAIQSGRCAIESLRVWSDVSNEYGLAFLQSLERQRHLDELVENTVDAFGIPADIAKGMRSAPARPGFG